MFAFENSPVQKEPHLSVEQMIDYLDRGSAAQGIKMHLTDCPACRITLDRHRRLLALDHALAPKREKPRSRVWFFGL